MYVNLKNKNCERVLIRSLDESDVSDVLELQDNVYESLPNKDWFQKDSKRDIFKNITESGIGCGAFCGDVLIAHSIMSFPGIDTHNLGIDIDLPREELVHVAHIETVVVNPEYRGNGLQLILMKILIKKAMGKGYFHILATVSPQNDFSRKNFQRCGFKRIVTKLKYGSKLRDIVYLKLI